MMNRFLIDPAQTDEEIVDFIMSVLDEDGAFEESPLNDHPPSRSAAIPDVKTCAQARTRSTLPRRAS